MSHVFRSPALVRAGISADGARSDAELRALVFLRLYGQDFDQVKCARVLACLDESITPGGNP